MVVCHKGGVFMYHQRQVNSEYDALRARFTVWLERLIKNAKINYLEEYKKEIVTISINALFEDEIPVACEDIQLPVDEDEFDFEEERIAEAFYELSLTKQKVLKMLFVDEYKPKLIAKQLNCSVQYVYNQRLRALNALRKKLSKGGEKL